MPDNSTRVFVPARSLDAWQALLADPDLHWKSGYSAMALANCWQSADGFPTSVATVLDSSPDLHGAELLLAIPEYRIPLPGRGRDSQTDLFALATTSSGLAAIAVEGKVEEPFDEHVMTWLKRGGDNREERLRGLCSELGIDREPALSLRYQLLHRTVAAIGAARRFRARHAVMLVHSFSPNAAWYEDYTAFVKALGGVAHKDQIIDIRDSDGLAVHLGWASGESRYLRPAGMIPARALLPFFAYGMFQPDEIAFPRIQPFVLEPPMRASVPGIELERDGLRLLVPSRDEQWASQTLDGTAPGAIDGWVIRFRPGEEISGYAAIAELEPRDLYAWEQAPRTALSDADEVEVNVLVGRSIRKGSPHVPFGRWSSREDPLFTVAMDIAGRKGSPKVPGEQRELAGFFAAQMRYLLLWSAIERYAALRFGFAGGPVGRIRRIATSEPTFAEALRDQSVVPAHRRGHAVYSAEKPGEVKETLDVERPDKAMGYYYQVRSNVTHRGKSAGAERDLVEACLRELHAIFSHVLDATLKPRRPPGERSP